MLCAVYMKGMTEREKSMVFYNPHMTAHHVWHENDVFLVPSFSLHFQKIFLLSTSPFLAEAPSFHFSLAFCGAMSIG